MFKKTILREQKLFVIILGLIVISLFLAIIRVTFLYQWLERKVSPTPKPTPTPIREVATPSAYATDSAILEIEADLKAIENDLKATDLRETGLQPPVLDMEVEFEE